MVAHMMALVWKGKLQEIPERITVDIGSLQ